MNRFLLPYLLIIIILASCGGKQTIPKPKGYNRIILPEHTYQILPDTLPYIFEYSQYAQLSKDSSWLSERYWINISYPQLNANIELTYKPLKKDKNLLNQYLDIAYRLTAKHQIKAYSMEHAIITTDNGNTASIYELEGEVPTQFQFFTTDSINHFLRGTLYFETALKNDSLAPAIEYIKIDMMHLLNTLEWK